MPNKLTDAEVKKALECCASVDDGCSTDCPLYGEDDSCFSTLLKPILDLINRQEFRIHQQEKIIMEIQNANLIDLIATVGNYKAENESLKEKNSNLTSDLTSLQNDLTSAKAEVERLQNAYKQCAWERDIFAEDMTQEIKKDCSYLMLDIKTIKAEAYKEIVELAKSRKRIVDVSTKFGCEVFEEVVTIKDIDNLLNELVGDGDAKNTQ